MGETGQHTRLPRIPLSCTRLVIAGLVGITLVAQGWRLYQYHHVKSAVLNGSADVDGLIAGMRHAEPAVRGRAAEALGQKGPETAMAALVQALADPAVHAQAGRALVRFGDPTVARLKQNLREGSPVERRHAAQVLAAMGPKAQQAAAALLEALQDNDPQVRQQAAHALGRIGPGPDAVPALTQALADPNSRVAREAAVALGRMGPQAAPAAAELAMMLKGSSHDDSDPPRRLRSRWVAEAAAEALGRIGAPAIPHLLDALAARSQARGGLTRDLPNWFNQALGHSPELAKLAGRVQTLFGDLGLRDDILAILRNDATLSAADRDFALQVAQVYREDAELLNEVSWKIVRTKDAGEQAYALAMRQAEAAARMAPDHGYILNTLGVAKYRMGHHSEAVNILTGCEKLNAVDNGGPLPADVAFLAMAQHRVGHKEQAAATFARLRELMRQQLWVDNDEAKAFLREAEEALGGSSSRR